MSRIAICLVGGVLFSMSAQAQSRPPKQQVDPCAPIGKTADGCLVYPLACDRFPVVTAPAPAQPAAAAPAAEEEDTGGLFRNPFPSIIRPTNTARSPGVGPPGSGR